MYGLQLAGKSREAVLYRFASTTSRDAWIEGGADRLGFDHDNEIEGLSVGEWTKATNLPAGALMYASVNQEMAAAAGSATELTS